MKYKLILFFVFSLFFFQLTYAQDKNVNQLVLFGDCTLKAQTDIAVFSFSFKGVGPSLDVAVSNAKDKIRSITNELRKIGLSEKNFSTSYFYSGENEGDKSFLSSSRDYKAEIKVTVIIDSLDLLEKSIITVSKNEPDYISEVGFSLKNYSQYVINALEKAGKNAKEKAEILAKQMGFKLGKPIYIEDIGLPSGGFGGTSTVYIRGGRSDEVLYMIDGLPKKKEGASFYSPETVINSRVKIIYQIE